MLGPMFTFSHMILATCGLCLTQGSFQVDLPGHASLDGLKMHDAGGESFAEVKELETSECQCKILKGSERHERGYQTVSQEIDHDFQRRWRKSWGLYPSPTVRIPSHCWSFISKAGATAWGGPAGPQPSWGTTGWVRHPVHQSTTGVPSQVGEIQMRVMRPRKSSDLPERPVKLLMCYTCATFWVAYRLACKSQNLHHCNVTSTACLFHGTLAMTSSGQ